MELIVSRMWASPSTLHLKVAVVPKNGKWIQFSELHIALDDFTAVLREAQREVDQVVGWVQDELALPYTDQHSQAQDG